MPYFDSQDEYRQALRIDCYSCSTTISWIDHERTSVHGIDLEFVRQGLELPSTVDLEAWVCPNCDNAGVFGPMDDPDDDGMCRVIELVVRDN